MLNLRLPQRLRDPFTALLFFGAAGILAMIVAFAITSLPRLGGPPQPPSTSVRQAQPAPAAETPSPSPSPPAEPHRHGKKGGGG